MNQKLSYLVKLFVGAGLILALTRLVPYHSIQTAFLHADIRWLCAGMFLFWLTFVCAALRWRYILAALGISITLPAAITASLAGYFFNLFFPSFVAGDVFRGTSISTHYGNGQKVASSVIMDRFSGGAALVCIATIAYICAEKQVRQPPILSALLLVDALFAFSCLLIVSRTFFSWCIAFLKNGSPLKTKILAFHEHMYFFRQNPRAFAGAMGYSFCVQIFTFIGFFVSAQAFHVPNSIVDFLTITPLIMAIALIPVSIAGLGTREAAAVYFFGLVGISKAVSISLSLFNFLFLLTLGITGGILYVSVYRRCVQSSA